MTLEMSNFSDDNKVYVEEIDNWAGTVTTYIGRAELRDFNNNISAPEGANIWKIRKIVEIDGWAWTVTTKTYMPRNSGLLADANNNYNWTNRASYTYL